MKTIIASLIFLLTATASQSQEVKIKKGKILIDGNEVALLDKKKRTYIFSALDGTPKFSIEKQSKEMKDGSTAYWNIITDISTGGSNEIPDVETGSLSFEKNIVSSVILGDYKFITSQGIDASHVSEFANGPKTYIAESLDGLNLEILEDEKQAEKLLADSKIFIANNGNILQKREIKDPKTGITGEANIIIGRVANQVLTDVIHRANLTYTAFDSRNQQIARWQQSGDISTVSSKFVINQFETYDKKLVNLKLDTFIVRDAHQKNARKFIGKLLQMRYTFYIEEQ